MEFIRTAKKLGNSAGVLLPKQLLGSEVKIILINKPFSIKKSVLKLIEPFLDNIMGIYVLNKKPIEFLAVSNNLKRIIKAEKIKISLVPLSIIRKDIKNSALREKLEKADAIINSALLNELMNS